MLLHMMITRSDLLSKIERSYYDFGCPVDRFSARSLNNFYISRKLEKLVSEVRWFYGEQDQDGFGPNGKCLVSWVDAYPLIIMKEARGEGFYEGLICGHNSCGGASVAEIAINMLSKIARSPDGRVGSDSPWLRSGGRLGFFSFYGVDVKADVSLSLEQIFLMPDYTPEAPLSPTDFVAPHKINISYPSV